MINIEIAGISMAVQCRFRENEEFFRDYRTEKTPLFRIEPDAADLLKMQMELDAMDRAEGRLHFQRDQRYLENVAIHSLIADRMVDHDVLVMHGSALCMDGEAYIFIASSGTGKSTHARFWREVFGDRVWMINDDKPMLRFMEDQVLVCGTPWDVQSRCFPTAAQTCFSFEQRRKQGADHGTGEEALNDCGLL